MGGDNNKLEEIRAGVQAIQEDQSRRNTEEDEREKAKLVEAAKIAREIVDHAKDEARQLLLGQNIDTSKIPLICNKIVKIQSDLSWMKTLLVGVLGGIGTLVIMFIAKGA